VTRPEPGDVGDPKDRHFATEDLTDDLGDRAVRGGLAVFGGQVGRFLLQTGSTVVLARLLTPTDFGLVAMVAAVTGFIGRFKDMGLTMATVQRETVTNLQASVLFWLNVAVSLGLTLLGVAIAPLVARFYGEPALVAIMVAFSLTFFLDGVPAQHDAVLRRQMRFRTLAAIDVASHAAGVAVALILAVRGAGYWALVALPIVQAVTRGLALMWASRWVPSLPRRGTDVRPMIRYGINLGGFSLFTFVGRSADDVLIGRVWGAGATGLYTKAYQLLMLPLDQINGPMNAVAIPVLSRLQSDPQRLKEYYLAAISLVAYATAPLIVVMGATAHDLIAIVLGPQWDRSATIFQILAFAAFFQPLLYTAGWLWLSLDRTHEMFRWSIVTAVSFVTAFAVGVRWGPEGVAIAYAIAVNAITPLGLVWSYRGTRIRLLDCVRVVVRPYGLSLGMLVTALVVGSTLQGWAVFPRLVSVVAISLVLPVSVAAALPSFRRDAAVIVEFAARARRAA
jgi:O-antigen/teichoic acid export membrane protein